MRIRLTHLDGKLPNLALMKLAHWHKARGDEIHFSRLPTPTMFEPAYDVVYGSAIFSWSTPVVERLRLAYPEAIIGGTGSGSWQNVEDLIGDEYEHYDYGIYPDYPHSLGFTQRGCRLKCSFCVVPKKEGKPRSTNTIDDIWRHGTPRRLVLLDNDFFGQDEQEWRTRIAEIRAGKFKVSFNQGINIRMINEETAAALASVRYYDGQFKRRRLYTAWDNRKDEQRVFKGLDMLRTAGIPTYHVVVYMLVGYWPGETMQDVFYRYERLREAGCRPYPMVYDRHLPDKLELRRFQRWVIGRYHEFIPWDSFKLAGPSTAEIRQKNARAAPMSLSGELDRRI